MNDFIEAMIKGHDKTEYKWISGKCAEFCSECSCRLKKFSETVYEKG